MGCAGRSRQVTLPLCMHARGKRPSSRVARTLSCTTLRSDPLPPTSSAAMPTTEPTLGCDCGWTSNAGACSESDESYCWNACCLYPAPEESWPAYYDQLEPGRNSQARRATRRWASASASGLSLPAPRRLRPSGALGFLSRSDVRFSPCADAHRPHLPSQDLIWSPHPGEQTSGQRCEVPFIGERDECECPAAVKPRRGSATATHPVTLTQ